MRNSCANLGVLLLPLICQYTSVLGFVPTSHRFLTVHKHNTVSPVSCGAIPKTFGVGVRSGSDVVMMAKGKKKKERMELIERWAVMHTRMDEWSRLMCASSI